MKRISLSLASKLAILALTLSACANEAAKPADVDYWPWNWWNSTLESTMAKKCAGLPAGSSVTVNGAYVPCPGTTIFTDGPGTPTEPTTTGPSTDAEFVKEMAQNVVGPAIVQLWDGASVPGCWILKVNQGQTLTKPQGYVGHYWLFDNQAALDNDWPNSLTQYQANNPQCTAPLPNGILDK